MTDDLRNISIIERIHKYCNDIQSMTDRFGDSLEAYNSDVAYQHACGMCIIQIGELTTRLTSDFKSVYDKVPWQDIKSMRNLFAHEYGAMRTDRIWNTIKNSIPELAAYCAEIIEQYTILDRVALEASREDEPEL